MTTSLLDFLFLRDIKCESRLLYGARNDYGGLVAIDWCNGNWKISLVLVSLMDRCTLQGMYTIVTETNRNVSIMTGS